MNTSTFNDMPFLSADDHILHQDSLVPLEETTYWSEMDPESEQPQHQTHQALLDPSYIDPETIMSASEALMRLSEQDLHIEPSLRSLNVGDNSCQSNNLMPAQLDFSSGAYSYAIGSGPSDASTRGHHHYQHQPQQQRLRLPPREPFDGEKIRLWTEQFRLAQTHAHRWVSSGTKGPGIDGEAKTSLPVPLHRASEARKASAVLSSSGVGKQPASKVPQ